MKKLSYLIFSILTMGCKMNYSVDMIPESPRFLDKYKDAEPSQIAEHFVDGVYYELKWDCAIPIYYVQDEGARDSEMMLYFYPQQKIDVEVEKVTINIKDIGYSRTFNSSDFSIYEPTYGVGDNYFWLNISIKRFMLDVLKKDEDLQIFKKVKRVNVKLSLTSEGKLVELKFNFIPQVNKSIAIWDGLMSV